MNRLARLALLPIAAVLFIAPPAFVQAGEGDDWEYSIAPYLWAAGLDGEAAVQGEVLEVDADFGDILDVLDGAFLVNFLATNGTWSYGADLIYLDLEQDLEQVDGELGLEQTILELHGGYRVAGGLDVIGGARFTDVEAEGDFVDPMDVRRTPQGDESWVDPFVGLRWNRLVGERWRLFARGDVGGFGVGSDFVWQARAGAGYRVSDLVAVVASLRAIDYDFEEDDTGFAYDVRMQGAELGVSFRF